MLVAGALFEVLVDRRSNLRAGWVRSRDRDGFQGCEGEDDAWNGDCGDSGGNWVGQGRRGEHGRSRKGSGDELDKSHFGVADEVC